MQAAGVNTHSAKLYSFLYGGSTITTSKLEHGRGGVERISDDVRPYSRIGIKTNTECRHSAVKLQHRLAGRFPLQQLGDFARKGPGPLIATTDDQALECGFDEVQTVISLRNG